MRLQRDQPVETPLEAEPPTRAPLRRGPAQARHHGHDPEAGRGPVIHDSQHLAVISRQKPQLQWRAKARVFRDRSSSGSHHQENQTAHTAGRRLGGPSHHPRWGQGDHRGRAATPGLVEPERAIAAKPGARRAQVPEQPHQRALGTGEGSESTAARDTASGQ